MFDWAESSPEDVGVDAAALSHVVDLVRARGVVAQLSVLRNREVVLDRTFGCRPDALLVHQLAERGELALDDAVARYWPEFGQQGKTPSRSAGPAAPLWPSGGPQPRS